MKSKGKLLFVVNVDWIFISHRLPIAIAAKKAGYEVIVAAKDSGKSSQIRLKGIDFIDIPISRSGTNILVELKLLFFMFNLYRKIKPDIIHHVTMKPLIYGSIVAKILRIRTVNAISGLGYVFTEGRKGTLQRLMIASMKFGFSKENNQLIFQNEDDYKELNNHNVVNHRNRVCFIKGVGVSLEQYNFENRNKNKLLSIVFPARMLWDKGVYEFVEAAKLLYPKYSGQVFFKMYGKIDVDYKNGVSESYLQKQKINGYLEWFGHKEDMISVYSKADIVVLPSYREGLPKVLIEACASGIPIVTTNAIGCKDCVVEGENGFKVDVKSVSSLADSIEKLILSSELRRNMGKKSREKALREFDQKDVIEKHINIYEAFKN